MQQRAASLTHKDPRWYRDALAGVDEDAITRGQERLHRIAVDGDDGDHAKIGCARFFAVERAEAVSNRHCTGDMQTGNEINARFRPGSRSGAEENFQKYGALDPKNQVNSRG